MLIILSFPVFHVTQEFQNALFYGVFFQVKLTESIVSEIFLKVIFQDSREISLDSAPEPSGCYLI